jgi:hypothetical protein
MPISTDTTRMSIEFIYEYQTPDGNVLQYQMKFQHTSYGPTITVAQAPYEPIELPADMFTEVSQFLAQQGAVRQLPIIGKTVTPGATTGTSNLPLPSIGRKMAMGPATPGSNARANQIAATNLVQEPGAAETASKFDISEEEADRLQKERLRAKAKAASAKKPFHPNHKEKGS